MALLAKNFVKVAQATIIDGKKTLATLRPTGLGRWNIEKTILEERKAIDLANHDHCGGPLCSVPPQPVILKPALKKAGPAQKSASAGKKDDDDDDDDDKFYWPFLL